MKNLIILFTIVITSMSLSHAASMENMVSTDGALCGDRVSDKSFSLDTETKQKDTNGNVVIDG